MNEAAKSVTSAELGKKWRKKCGFTPAQFREFAAGIVLSEMQRGHQEGHAIAALDALSFCRDRNLAIPDWAAKAIVTREHLTKRRKGQKPPELQYRQYVKNSIRYLTVRACEDKSGRNKEKRLDKFGEAFEALEGHPAATKDVTGLKKSFYEYKKKWHEFYLSYICYCLFPESLAFLCSVFNQRQPIWFDWSKK